MVIQRAGWGKRAIMERGRGMSVSIEPLTPALWPAFEDLFGKQGACYGCWCTHFRLPPAARRASTNERNKDHIRARI
jgi:hypothetical protein